MTQLSYDTISEAILDEIPELADSVQAEVEWWGGGDVPLHVLFGDVVVPYLASCVKADDEPSVQRVLEFVERMACHADDRIVDVVRVSVLEVLVSKRWALDRLRERLGECTTRLLDDLVAWRPE